MFRTFSKKVPFDTPELEQALKVLHHTDAEAEKVDDVEFTNEEESVSYYAETENTETPKTKTIEKIGLGMVI